MMPLDFSLSEIQTTEFGVGKDTSGGQEFSIIPADEEVQQALEEMVADTWAQLEGMEDEVEEYQASEKHGSKEYRTISLDDDLVEHIKELHEAENMDADSDALEQANAVFCYFARLTDSAGKKLTAIRRATQFKGVLKSRLIRLGTDTIRIVEDKVFKLDRDFDFLVDDEIIHILRPTGFEFVGGLSDAILEAVPGNISTVKADMAFVEFANVEEYAKKHPRAARYLASICSSNEAAGVNQTALVNLCQQTGVSVSEDNNVVQIAAGHEMGFLEVLDRRRYQLELVSGTPEQYRAASRSKLGGN